jgi:hypothetical protein
MKERDTGGTCDLQPYLTCLFTPARYLLDGISSYDNGGSAREVAPQYGRPCVTKSNTSSFLDNGVT